jgi:hypothetical protein
VERKSNITVWQLRLFEGFDRDIMVMQRNEEEVFDDAIHVFFEKEYYNAYVARAAKYSTNRYAYHEDKLGEVIYQIYDEGIKGLVLHIGLGDGDKKNQLSEEKYISARDLMSIKDAADSYHYLYTTSIDRCDKNDAIAHLWTKYVYVVGQLPNPRVKDNGNQVYELMTIKRNNDNTPASADKYDYESLKVFLTMDSAMRFNPDKKPINKYRLSMLSQVVKGKLRVIIEPHRNYWLEFDPANLDLKGHLELPVYNEEMVKERIATYAKLDKVYVLLSPSHSDYRLKIGNPLLVKADEKNIVMHIFEKYDEACEFVIQNPTLLPVFDYTFPIGETSNLEEVLCLASKFGVTVVSLDTDTLKSIACRMTYFMEEAGYNRELEEFLPADELEKVMRVDDEGNKQYRMPLINFSDQINEYEVSEERKAEVVSHVDGDLDNGLSFMAGCSIAEMILMAREVATRFDTARKENNEEDKVKYNRLMNLYTVPITEALCEKPYIYALRDEKGEFVVKNNIVYLIFTNRYEVGRKGDGKIAPASIDNIPFMDKLVEASGVAAVTDGPSLLCFVDTKLMREVAIQWKKNEPLREELIIYMTQGQGLTYNEARYYYKRLKSDSSIFAEFIATIANGDYPEVGMLNIEGHTARELADKYGYSVLEAYDALLSIKVNNKLEDKGEDNEEYEEKKGLFGKIFKK